MRKAARYLVFGGWCLAIGSAFAAVPTVSNVAFGGGRKAVVTYDLSGDPGIVTMAVETNSLADLSGAWLPINGTALRNVQGDVSQLVQPGIGHRITWRPLEPLGAPLKNARVVLTAWPTNAPPDYLVVNLAGQDVPRYYTSTNYFPYGFGHLTYKTTNIVFKLVRAKGHTFCAGEFSCVDSYGGGNPHVINMTRDYYLGIYELTQSQYHWATGKQCPYSTAYWPSGTMWYDSPKPAETIWRTNLRTGNYTNDPGDETFVGAMRRKTGLYAELPTEAQWEFAARCGGYRTKYYGAYTKGLGTQIVAGEQAAFRDVANVKCYDKTDTYGQMIPVGSLKPNDWGFYDMIGNVAEMCLDWVHCASGNTPDRITVETTDPMGLAEGGSGYVMRGATFNSDYGFTGTSRSTYGEAQKGYGARIAVNLEPPTTAPVVSAAIPGASSSPEVAGVKLGQNPANRNIVVSYNLSKHAIVTWTLETNAVANATDGWVAVDESKANTRIWGDVNRLVEKTGGCSFSWSPDVTWADQAIAEGRVRAVLTAWPTNNPPLYMVADLAGMIVNYYTSTNALPEGGLSNALYATRKLVFRKIPAKDVVWTMGVPDYLDDGAYSNWTAANRTNNTPHKVKLTYDYYVAVNELSRAQWAWTMNDLKGYGWVSKNFSLTNDLPVGGCYCSSYRTSEFENDQLAGRLRTYFGDRYPIDLISSAEWEYAYRAGEEKTLFSGLNWDTWANHTQIGNVNNYDERGTLRVFDQIPPNRWGLYHMYGNLLDMTRDGSDPLAWTNAVDKETGIAVDPNDLSVSSTAGRGCFRLQWYQIRQGDYWTSASGAAVNSLTPRLVCPIPKNAD